MAASVIAAVSAVSSVAATARADDTGDLESVLNEPVVSTASKSAETESVAPATTTTITAEDMRRYGIHSLDEAIDFLSLGMVTSNPLHSVDVGARGVLLSSDYGNHVLLLVNGHTLNEAWDGTAYFERGAAIPFELIDHIEVILGPGSVLYGSNAMLGVINVITKKAKDYAGVHLITEAELSPSVGRDVKLRRPKGGDYLRDLGTTLRVAGGLGYEFTIGKTPAELTLQLEYFTQNGPAFTFGPQTNGTSTWGGYPARDQYWTQVPTGYVRFIAGNFEVNFRAASYSRATPYVNAFNQTIAEYNDGYDHELDRWLDLDVRHQLQVSTKTSFTQRFYADSYDFQQFLRTHDAGQCTSGIVNGCNRHVIGISRWMGSELQLSTDWNNDTRYVTLIGVDGRIRRVGQLIDDHDIVTFDNPGSINSSHRDESLLALYLQQTLTPLRWLSISAGVRGDFEQRFGKRFSPRVAASASTWKGGTFKVIYAEAFRTPTTYELDYADTTAQIAARDLHPETVRSVEASIEHKFGAQRLLFGVFRSWWHDLIVLETAPADQVQAAKARGAVSSSVADSAFTQYHNVATIDNYGMNAAFEGALGVNALRYALQVTAAYARRNFDDGRPSIPLTVAPQVFGNARLSYHFLDERLPTLALAGRMVGRRPVDRAFDTDTPVPYASAQVELRATVSGPVPGVTGLAYRFTANYAFAARGPYVAGPTQAASPDQPHLETAPVDRFRIGLGLEYALPL